MPSDRNLSIDDPAESRLTRFSPPSIFTTSAPAFFDERMALPTASFASA